MNIKGIRLMFEKMGKRPFIMRGVQVPGITSHIKGKDAVKMFKLYGAIEPPSQQLQDLWSYVPEARIKYGLQGNKDITNWEIAAALYKLAKLIALSENPLPLFRGDNNVYTKLKQRMSPDELAQRSGTMDNAWGNLFLGSMPRKGYEGIDRYLHKFWHDGYGWKFEASATGGAHFKNPGSITDEKAMAMIKGGAPVILSLRGLIWVTPSEFLTDGVNNINLFIPRKPKVRNSNFEIAIGNEDRLLKGIKTKNGKFAGSKGTRFTFNDNGTVTDNVKLVTDLDLVILPDSGKHIKLREMLADHMNTVLADAKKLQQTLLKSEGDPKHPMRGEHNYYDYYALPNYAINTVKHILPYDMRIPRNFNIDNIFLKQGGKI